jgi:hypothetical protein
VSIVEDPRPLTGDIAARLIAARRQRRLISQEVEQLNAQNPRNLVTLHLIRYRSARFALGERQTAALSGMIRCHLQTFTA